jgi:glycosyltransferase involved in cell wall biosynthesis
MRVVIDAIPVVPFGGYAVAFENMLAGWERLGTEDEIHILATEGVDLRLPESMTVHRFDVGSPQVVRRVAVQSRAARRICREVGAEVLLGALPTTALGDVGCPKVITVYDLRHEILPEQFSRGRRLLRRISYGIGYRQAAGMICISKRTRGDLVRSRPKLRRKPIFSVLFAADHVDEWPRTEAAEPYALAFGHFPNKAVDRVVDAWAILKERGDPRPLVFVGVPKADREGVTARIRAAGLEGLVTILPWLEDDEFKSRFASAGLIVFPSDFEGFGIPAIEAMRLGIPLVISDDAALLEVTGGNATVVTGREPAPLADAVEAAWASSPEQLERARAHVSNRTWADVARETRTILAEVAAGTALSAEELDAARAATERSPRPASRGA